MPDADNPDRLLSTLLIGNNLANTAASAAGTALALEFAPGHPVLAATIAVTVILLLFAEITPKVLAASFAEPVVLAVAQPLDHIARVATPLIKILSLALPGAALASRGGRQQRDETISEDIKTMAVLGREEGTIGKDEQEMIHSVVESGALSAGQFMVSRIDIMSLDLDLPREEAINLVIESGHSPIPVYRGSKDHIDGVLQARDYLVAWRRGKAGIVTLEDMLGEVLAARRDGSITVSGQIALDDLNAKAGLALPDEEFQTLSGLLVNQLGRVPYPGEEIALPGVVFQVLDADHRRIYRLAMKKIPPQSG